mgnify:CR=1 FL=1|tara:strand:- start:858 stop:1703 length:846 start_codon:yes stop_codon:yes gene_type:complete
MAASRDDFVIAIRSAFLKKDTQQRFSLVALLLFCIVLITLSRLNFSAINYLKISLNEIIYRAAFIASIPEQQIKKNSIIIKEHFALYSDYKITKDKLQKLEAKEFNTSFILSENKRLRTLIDEYVADSEKLVGKVLLDKNSPFKKSIIINKGSKDSVQIGMAVLDKEYLVGKIVEVNYSTSRALLVSDLNSKIPVAIEPGNVQSILSGSGKNYGILQYFKEESNLDKNSIVYTSGSGGIFKSGIPVGRIKKSNLENNEINFFSDVSQLNFVTIVSFKNGEK